MSPSTTFKEAIMDKGKTLISSLALAAAFLMLLGDAQARDGNRLGSAGRSQTAVAGMSLSPRHGDSLRRHKEIRHNDGYIVKRNRYDHAKRPIHAKRPVPIFIKRPRPKITHGHNRPPPPVFRYADYD
jgi:hypothetical protein